MAQPFDTNNSANFMNTNTQSSITNNFDTNTSSRPSITRAPINFNNTEIKYFETVFNLVTSDGLSASGKNIVPQFRSTGVVNNQLKEIWLKSATQTDAQSKSEFYCALLLLGLAQNEQALTKDNLMNPRTRFIPFLPNLEMPLELRAQNDKVKECLKSGEPLNLNSSPKGKTPPRNNDTPKAREESPDFVDRLRDTFTGGRHSFFEDEQDKPKNLGMDIPEITPTNLEKYESFVRNTKTSEAGILKGSEAVNIFSQSRLTKKQLSTVWNLVDRGQKGLLNASEFIMAVFMIELTKKGYEMPARLPPHLTTFLSNYDAQKMGASCIEHKAPESGSNETSSSNESQKKKNHPNNIEQLEDISRETIEVNYSKPYYVANVDIGSNGMDFITDILDSYQNLTKKHEEEVDNFNNDMSIIEFQTEERMNQILETFKEIDETLDARDKLREGLFEALKSLEGSVMDDTLRNTCVELANFKIDERDMSEMRAFVGQKNQKLANLSFNGNNNNNPFQPEPENQDLKLSNEEFDLELSNMFGFD